MEPFQCVKTEIFDEYFEMQEVENQNNASQSSTSPQLQNNNDDDDELALLLIEWNLFDQLYGFLKASGLTVEGLKYIKPRHLDQLFARQNLNTKIIFEHHLTIWQQSFGIYYLLPCAQTINFTPTTTSSVPLPPAHKKNNETATTTTTLKDLQPCVSTETLESLSCTSNGYPDEIPVHDSLTIRDILCITEDSKRLLKIYNEMEILLAPHRTAIVHNIVEYFFERNIKITVKLCKLIAEQIIIVFPTEKLETYFAQINSKLAPKGKIWDRYQSCKRRLKRMRTLDSKKNKDNTSINTDDDHDDESK